MNKGVYKITNKTTVEITELPIGTWTDNYKEFLDSIMININKLMLENRKSNV